MRVLAWALVLALAGLSAALHRPDELAWPTVGPPPVPAFVEATGVRITGLEGLPGVAARRLVPVAVGGVLRIGGTAQAFDLEGVELQPAPGLVVRAAAGRLTGEVLELERLVVSDASGGTLRAATASVRAARIAFPRLVAVETGSGQSLTRRGVVWSWSELVAVLGG